MNSIEMCDMVRGYNATQRLIDECNAEVRTMKPILTTTRSLFQFPQLDLEYNLKRLAIFRANMESKQLEKKQ